MTTAIDSSTSQSTAELFAGINAKNNSGLANQPLSSASEQNDRFLKLLTTQLTNQDPLNPMDNAQMTSQMAQISTVTGLEQLNASMATLGSQFMQLQAMQGASLIGREVMVEGNALSVVDGKARGGYEVAAGASQVKLEVLNAAGQMVKTVSLGAQSAGRHQFSVSDAGLLPSTGYQFRVVATSGSTSIDTTQLAIDKVSAVNTSGKTLTLELAKAGQVPYSAVQSIN